MEEIAESLIRALQVEGIGEFDTIFYKDMATSEEVKTFGHAAYLQFALLLPPGAVEFVPGTTIPRLQGEKK